MSSNIIKYDLTVKNYNDLEKLTEQFSKFAKVSKINNVTYVEFGNKYIRVFVQDYFAPIKIGSVVRHFKGKEYYIQDRVINSEDNKSMLVYQAMYSPYEKYVRYESEFTDLVNFEKHHNARQCYRFEVIVPKKTSR